MCRDKYRNHVTVSTNAKKPGEFSTDLHLALVPHVEADVNVASVVILLEARQVFLMLSQGQTRLYFNMNIMFQFT